MTQPIATFEERSARLRRIFRGEETYGEGEPARQAERFHREHLLPEVVVRARAASAHAAEGADLDLLVSLSGFSPATTILAYEVLRPRRVFVISSAAAAESLDRIGGYLCSPGRLRHSEFSHRRCDPTQPLDIYRIVHDELAAARRTLDRPPRAILDITGGKKVMSASAALAAWQLDLPLCYLESVFDPELRQPVPGTERLLLLDNPTTLFGDEALRTAIEVFDAGSFEAAHGRFADLADRISEPTQARFFRDLAALYRAWCDLDLDGLRAPIVAVRSGLDDPRVRLARGVDASLRDQIRFLERLAAKDRPTQLLGFYLLGLHYDRLGRSDFAAMLFYRCLEGCCAARLERHFPGFDCSRPDYGLLGVEREELRGRFVSLWGGLGDSYRADDLPRQLGFVPSAVMLAALGDDLLREAGFDRPKQGLARLRHLAEVRNRSVLAHGYETVRPEDTRHLAVSAKAMLRAFTRLEVDAGSDGGWDALGFVRLAS